MKLTSVEEKSWISGSFPIDLEVVMQTDIRPRKACDLCYTRKIKCDAQEPRCSNCVVYGVDCTHTAVSRQSKPRVRRSGGIRDVDHVQNLQAQIQDLKAQLGRHQLRDATQDSIQAAKKLTTEVLAEDCLTVTDSHLTGSMTLPPLEETMIMVGAFLNTFNSFLPLFHPDTLLRLVGECYAILPHQRDPVVWAAINVVLALASQVLPQQGLNECIRTRGDCVKEYLNKAQSVVSTAILGETRLINVQTLVGMTMILQTEHNQNPALIMISAAMRLVHKLGLHDRAASAHLNPVERRQHARVFWLAYILDKDLSIRAGQPSLQADDDIDLELPSPLPYDEGDTSGTVNSARGNSRMDYFLARVQLANIQGGVYDCLYSTRARNRTPQERTMARHSIVNALEKWQASIPADFRPAFVASSTSNNPANSGFFCVLHSCSLLCMTLVNRAHAWDEQWVSAIRKHGNGAESPQLPSGWGALVRQARDYMLLFEECWSEDVWFRWLTSCTYASAMVLLIANGLNDISRINIRQDCELIETALLWFQETIKATPSKQNDSLRDTCVHAMKEIKQRRAANIAMRV